MNRNLITRMGTASGVVAALVAAVFAVLVTAVRDQRSSTDAARHSQMVIVAADRVRQDLVTIDIGQRGKLSSAPDVVASRNDLATELATTLPKLLADDPQQLALLSRIRQTADDGSSDRLVDQLIAAEQARADARRNEADHKASQAIALGIGGLVGSAVLIALLATYLTRYIVVPVQQTARAARRLARGDLSARVAAEGDAEPIELARSFNMMADSLQESERLKDEFFALVSHELRTPLTSIIGYLELVLDDEQGLSDESRRFLEVVDRNAKRLLRLVGDMLFVAQVEAGRLTLESHDVDLGRVVADAVEAARPAAERAGVTLELQATPVPPIAGDGDRFGQMLDNVISNALKFTPEGGSVAVTLTDRGNHAEILVSDTGTGIPEAEQERLFERFFRASSATSRGVPGAGLGLAIVKTIVEAHGGAVDLSSQLDEGTAVRLDIPYAPVESPT